MIRKPDPNPIRLFQKWLDRARQSEMKEPTAMTLATSTANGNPSARMVLLKGVDERGFVFFTNYRSRKGRELAQNPRAALVLYWPELDRQVRITGRVERVSDAESDAYFYSRPIGSRYSAAASKQSSVIDSRGELERGLRQLKQRYRDHGPPRPKQWGGYRVQPDEIEFWEQGEHRLHDRLRYRRRGGAWKIERLAP